MFCFKSSMFVLPFYNKRMYDLSVTRRLVAKIPQSLYSISARREISTDYSI